MKVLTVTDRRVMCSLGKIMILMVSYNYRWSLISLKCGRQMNFTRCAWLAASWKTL